MRMNGWSRGDRIALLSLLIGLVACVAALIVVPETRQWLGLESNKESSKERQKSEESTPQSMSPTTSDVAPKRKSSEPSYEDSDITPVKEIEENGITIKYNAQHQIVELSNLYNDELCYEQSSITGSIVKIKYEDDETRISGLILEDASGRRIHINVGTEELYGRLSSAVMSGLSSLFQNDKKVSVLVIGCGASGRMLWVKNIKAI